MRSPLSRAATAAFAAWFALVAIDAPGVHACGMHDAPGGEHEHRQHPASTHERAPLEEIPHEAAHHVHDSAAAETPTDHAPSDDTRQCLCLGDCAGAVAVVVPAQTLELVSSTHSTRVERPEVAAAPIVRADLSLPFATAPPMKG
jgi:hypothetical protein